MTEVLTYEALKAERDALERQLSMSEAKCKGYFSDAAAALVKCDALAQRVEMLAHNLGNAIWGEQEALQRVNALAVENAALKNAITTHSQSTHFCELCGKDDPCSTDDVCYALNETKATDAAIAGIEALGVEKFAKLFEETVDMELKHNQEFHNGTLWFASTLREAK